MGDNFVADTIMDNLSTEEYCAFTIRVSEGQELLTEIRLSVSQTGNAVQVASARAGCASRTEASPVIRSRARIHRVQMLIRLAPSSTLKGQVLIKSTS